MMPAAAAPPAFSRKLPPWKATAGPEYFQEPTRSFSVSLLLERSPFTSPSRPEAAVLCAPSDEAALPSPLRRSVMSALALKEPRLSAAINAMNIFFI